MTPTTRLLFLDKKTLGVDALLKKNMLTKKNGNTKIKTNDMNNDACDGAEKIPVFLNNEATPYTTVFDSVNTAPTAGASGAASTIVSDAHITPSGKK